MNPSDGGATAPAASLYPRVVQYVRERPWAILESTFNAIVEVVSLRASGLKLTDDEIRERIEAGPGVGQPQMSGGVAVIPLYGAIFPRATMMSAISGGVSLVQFTQMLREAVANPQVEQILLDVNSPGGVIDLVPETAAEIRKAAQAKPVVAVANTMAASAAYWLASQATELVVTPSGSVGSIGVFMVHDDYSGALAKAGIKPTYIKAGRFKAEANPDEPLTDEAKAALQASVDEFYGMFVADVSIGRGTPSADVRNGFGEGRMVNAKAAVRAGMADRVDTFDSTLARMLRGQSAKRSARAEFLSVEELEAYISVLEIPGLALSDAPVSEHDQSEALLHRADRLTDTNESDDKTVRAVFRDYHKKEN